MGRSIPEPSLAALVADAGLADVDTTGIPVPFDWGRSLAGRLGLDARMTFAESEHRARGLGARVLAATVRRFGEVARETGATPIILKLDIVSAASTFPPDADTAAREAGIPTVDLLHLWEGRDEQALRVGSWDNHPNAEGHRVIADALYEALTAQPVLLEQ
jgi:hypothetical protein